MPLADSYVLTETRRMKDNGKNDVLSILEISKRIFSCTCTSNIIYLGFVLSKQIVSKHHSLQTFMTVGKF